MALFALGDLHLSLGADKPMSVFPGWEDHVARVEANWRRLVSPEDTVVICGDVSWSMKLEDTRADFAFIDSLPGKKYIIKGNHDYWWNTKKKMDAFLIENDFRSIEILHNNSFPYNGYSLCGTRGWSYDCPQSEQNILARECGRLKMSLDAGKALCGEPLVFLHYPPVFSDYRCDEIMDVLHEYNVKTCCYGHLHSTSHLYAVTGMCEGIDMKLVSCDFARFMPVLIAK